MTDETRIRVITPADAEWPTSALDALTNGNPRPGEGPPEQLWLYGTGRLDQLTGKAVAITGSRAATPYGQHIAGGWAYTLASQSGYTIVAGGGFGVEAAAHRGALAAGGRTLAVLPCGVDLAHPPAHQDLFDRIADGGLLVSEHPPGTVPSKERHLVKCRLLAALAHGVVVVEAGLRSGAQSTVAQARRCRRPAMAVPGPITSSASKGVNSLIRTGHAVLVHAADQVDDTLRPATRDTTGNSSHHTGHD